MIFHLITIQNTRTDDTVFHGMDHAALTIELTNFCRENWPYLFPDGRDLPEDHEALIKDYFDCNEREFLIEQEFTLELPEPYASAPQLLNSVQEMLHYLETPGHYNDQDRTAIMEFAADLDNRLTPPDPEEEEEAEAIANPDCTACNDGSCPWCQAEKAAAAI
jgi:hypothetical protein